MNVSYDKKADAKYIRIKKGTIAKTTKQYEWLLFDQAKNGDVLGVEILDASKHQVSIFTMGNKLVECFILKTKQVSERERSMEFTLPDTKLHPNVSLSLA